MGFQIWDVLEGGHLFHGTDPEHDTYRSRAHLAEMIALLGPPPPGLVARGSLRFKFFSEQGQSPVSSPLLRAGGPDADAYLLLRGIPSRYQSTASRLFGTIGNKPRKFGKKAVFAIYEQDVTVESPKSADGEATS